MASQNVARLGVVLGLDFAEFQKGIDEAVAATAKLKKEIRSDSYAAAKELRALMYATEDYGKALTKVEQIQREIAGGRFKNATQELKNDLLKQAAAYDLVAANANKARMAQIGMLGGTAGGKLNQQQISALSYQTTDILTGLASGQNPLMVLIQQGGQLRDQFGGFVPLFKAIASVFTVTRVAVVGFTAAIGGLAYAAYKGSEDFKELRNSLALTNNIAGLTYDSIRRLSGEMAGRLNISLSDSKDIFLELIRSGRFTSDSMASVANVIGNVARLSGETASTVAKDLIPSFNGTASSAKSLNDRFNFLTEAQYRQIEALELAGRKQDAAKMTADLLNRSLENQKEQLQINEGWWSKTTRAVSDFIEKLKQLGADETDEQKLKRLANRIQELSEVSILGLFKFEPKAYGGLRDQAIKDYLAFFEEITKKRQQLEADAAKKQAEKQGIDDFAAAGGEKKRQEIIAETRKIYADQEFQERVANANEFERIEYEADRKKREALLQLYRQNELTKYKFTEELAEQYIAKYLTAEQEARQKILEVSRKAAEEVRKEQQNRADAIQTEREKLEIYERNLLISEADYKIALNRLKAEQEIAKIQANQQLTPEAKEAAIAKERDIQRSADEVALLEEKLQHLKGVNSIVWKSMENAIDQFVRTGKISFKDFARSVIQDILAMYMKAQLLQMFRGLGSLFSGGGSWVDDGTGFMTLAGGMADGGFNPGIPTLVGENGPELFIPQTAGTVIPNQQLSNYMGNQPQVVYNGPYIQNMSAIDTQSAVQFLSRNKDAVYAANLSATRSLPASR